MVASIAGEVDLSNADELRGALEDAMAPDAVCLVLDLGELEHLDSAGIHMLSALGATLEQRGHDLRVVRPRRRGPATVFAIAGMELQLALYDTREAVLGALPG